MSELFFSFLIRLPLRQRSFTELIDLSCWVRSFYLQSHAEPQNRLTLWYLGKWQTKCSLLVESEIQLWWVAMFLHLLIHHKGSCHSKHALVLEMDFCLWDSVLVVISNFTFWKLNKATERWNIYVPGLFGDKDKEHDCLWKCLRRKSIWQVYKGLKKNITELFKNDSFYPNSPVDSYRAGCWASDQRESWVFLGWVKTSCRLPWLGWRWALTRSSSSWICPLAPCSCSRKPNTWRRCYSSRFSGTGLRPGGCALSRGNSG